MNGSKTIAVYVMFMAVCLMSSQITSCELIGTPHLSRLTTDVCLNQTKSSLLVKRSLCNTFGGCGSKRSLETVLDNYDGQEIGYPSERDQMDDAYTSGIDKKKAKLVAEILDDWLYHLQRDQRYKQEKYIVVNPEQHYRQQASVVSKPSTSDI